MELRVDLVILKIKTQNCVGWDFTKGIRITKYCVRKLGSFAIVCRQEKRCG
jgi:hypothetical protein